MKDNIWNLSTLSVINYLKFSGIAETTEDSLSNRIILNWNESQLAKKPEIPDTLLRMDTRFGFTYIAILRCENINW